MNVKELYDATFDECAEAEYEMDRNHMRAALGLRAFILILIERGSVKWEDDSIEITRIHHRIKTSSDAVKEKTNEMILDKMIDL